MSKLYDVVAVTGEYQTQDGSTKKKYKNCGSVFSGKKGGQFLKLESLPFDEQGKLINFFTLYEPKVKEQSSAPDDEWAR